MQGELKELWATEWPEPKVNSTQSPLAAVTVSGVKVKPGPTWTEWTVEDDELDEAAAAAVVVADEESPYWGEARVDVASTERTRAVDDRTECIFVVVV